MFDLNYCNLTNIYSPLNTPRLGPQVSQNKDAIIVFFSPSDKSSPLNQNKSDDLMSVF